LSSVDRPGGDGHRRLRGDASGETLPAKLYENLTCTPFA
jgi:hypothetical protein